MSFEVMGQLRERVAAARSDDAVHVVVLTGAGERAFCSGADLDTLVGPVLHTSTSSIELAQKSARTYDHIFNLRKPTIAAVEGYAVAGGFELMISCDFALASTEAKIGDFHMRRGLFGGAGPIYRLPRILGLRRAKELMLTGKLLTGEQAADWGLINACAPPDKFDALILEFCKPFLELSPFCMWMTKMAANRGMDADTDSLIVLETMTCNVVHHSDDAKEGVRAFLEKRKPNWTGH